MAATDQAKSLLPSVKPPIPEDFKGLMDIKTILNFIYCCELNYSLISISKRFMQDLFTIGLL